MEWNCRSNNGLSMLSEGKSINGVVICKKTADILEIINWESDSDELLKELFYKARAMGYKRIGAAEKQSDAKRINKLLKAGFEAIQTHEGLFNDDKAVMLIKQL